MSQDPTYLLNQSLYVGTAELPKLSLSSFCLSAVRYLYWLSLRPSDCHTWSSISGKSLSVLNYTSPRLECFQWWLSNFRVFIIIIWFVPPKKLTTCTCQCNFFQQYCIPIYYWWNFNNFTYIVYEDYQCFSCYPVAGLWVIQHKKFNCTVCFVRWILVPNISDWVSQDTDSFVDEL